MNLEQKLKELIPVYAESLDLPGTSIPADKGDVLLATLAGVESSFGRNIGPRFESSYYLGGRYYRKSAVVRKLVHKYGRDAAKSWGPFQIMYPTAWDLGYRGLPRELEDPETSIQYAVKYLNKYCLCWERASLRDIADAYNSGNPWDDNVPEAYITKFKRFFNNEAFDWIRDGNKVKQIKVSESPWMQFLKTIGSYFS